MKKVISSFKIIIIPIILFSCVTKPSTSPDPISSYKLVFSKVGKLKQMNMGIYGMGYTSDGEYLYVVNGSGKGAFGNEISASNVLMRYNVSADKWSVNPITLKPKRYNSAEYVEDKIYIFNGYDTIFGIGGPYRRRDTSIRRRNTPIKIVNENVEVFDIDAGTVTYLSKNPFPAYYSGSAVWNDKIYVFGGATSGNLFSNKLLMYDPEKDLWTKLTDMPEYKQVRGEIVNGVLYIFGGFNGLSLNAGHAYDIANDTWYYLGEMPISISANAITKHGDFIWLVGDYQKLNTVAVFNTKTGEFHVIKSNMSGRRHAGAEIIGYKLYVFGGNRQSSGSFLSSIQSADISEIEKLLFEQDIDIDK